MTLRAAIKGTEGPLHGFLSFFFFFFSLSVSVCEEMYSNLCQASSFGFLLLEKFINITNRTP